MRDAGSRVRDSLGVAFVLQPLRGCGSASAPGERCGLHDIAVGQSSEGCPDDRSRSRNARVLKSLSWRASWEGDRRRDDARARLRAQHEVRAPLGTRFAPLAPRVG